MLQIRLRKPPSEGTGGVKPLPVETVTVACPDHLVLADLPVAKGIGAATAASLVKTVGRRSRRPLGDRVHFCVRCDFPIAIYGRLVLIKQNCSILLVAFKVSILCIFPFLVTKPLLGHVLFQMSTSDLFLLKNKGILSGNFSCFIPSRMQDLI